MEYIQDLLSIIVSWYLIQYIVLIGIWQSPKICIVVFMNSFQFSRSDLKKQFDSMQRDKSARICFKSAPSRYVQLYQSKHLHTQLPMKVQMAQEATIFHITQKTQIFSQHLFRRGSLFCTYFLHTSCCFLLTTLDVASCCNSLAMSQSELPSEYLLGSLLGFHVNLFRFIDALMPWGLWASKNLSF